MTDGFEGLGQALQALSMPRTKVVDASGNPASIDNYDNFMQFLMLASLNGNIYKMRKIAEDQVSVGGTIGDDLAITSVKSDYKFQRPCQSASVINDGPGLVYIWVNDPGSYPRGIKSGSPFYVDFGGHKLCRLYFQCPAGATATVEISAKY
jgi:hypothetical protein